MKNLIVANWKMNPATLKEAKMLFEAVKKVTSKNTEVVICPPFVYLPLLKGMPLGAQNIHFEEKGAFTGEVSATQLKDLEVEYVIIGHSERRKHFGETNEIINKKIKVALKAGLKVIFCVGENEGEDKQAIIEKQVTEGLAGISKLEIQNSKLAIAYEPVWAIGTGKNCSTDETMKAVLLIRKILTNLYKRETADNVRIIYGGSVNSKNSEDYLKNAGVNGLLPGGAFNAEEFLAIIKSADLT